MSEDPFLTEYKNRVMQFAEDVPALLQQTEMLRLDIINQGNETMSKVQEILASGSADLIKCPEVVLETQQRHVYTHAKSEEITCNDIITFNHKGIGTLLVPADPTLDYKSWGMTYSTEMRTERLVQFFMNQDLVNKTVVSLAMQNRRKMLGIFRDVHIASPHLKTISEVMKRNAELPIWKSKDTGFQVLIPRPSYGTNDMKIELCPTMIDKVVIKTRRSIQLAWTTNPDSYAQQYIDLNIDDNDALLTLIQFPDTLKIILNDMIARLDNDKAIMDQEISSVKQMLSIYMITSALKA